MKLGTICFLSKTSPEWSHIFIKCTVPNSPSEKQSKMHPSDDANVVRWPNRVPPSAVCKPWMVTQTVLSTVSASTEFNTVRVTRPLGYTCHNSTSTHMHVRCVIPPPHVGTRGEIQCIIIILKYFLKHKLVEKIFFAQWKAYAIEAVGLFFGRRHQPPDNPADRNRFSLSVKRHVHLNFSPFMTSCVPTCFISYHMTVQLPNLIFSLP